MEPFTHAFTSLALARAGGRRLPRFGTAMLVVSGLAPDLDRHIARVNESARRFLLKPLVSHDEWMGLACGDGMRRCRRFLHSGPQHAA